MCSASSFTGRAMYFLIRKLTGGADAEAVDSEYSGDRLVLGASDNAAVVLPGLTGEIVVSGKGDGACTVTGRGLQLRLDGSEVARATLPVGGEVNAGDYLLRVLDPPAGFDVALQLETETALSDSATRASQSVDKAPFSLRAVSWSLVLLIIIGALALPLAGVFSPPLGETLRNTALPDDSLWTSGPLHEAHQRAGVGDDCGACHGKPFVMVEDASCLGCHQQLTEHADVQHHPIEAFAGERCASCHREHNEPARLVRRDPPLCTDCHADPAQWASNAGDTLRSVSGFEASSHPEFQVAHWVPEGIDAALGWRLARRPGPAVELEETSGLKFNHAVHLDEDKVQREQSGAPMACADCHQLKDSGEHFEPVSMDTHCRACHSLGFDSYEPKLELPHGDLRAAIVAMEAHFIREFTDPVLRQERAGQRPRRVPGKRDASGTCTDSGLACGREEAAREAQYQLAETGCITCHDVRDTGSAELSDRWAIHPVRLTTDYFVEARFDHLSHMSQASDSPDALCEDCHGASVSQSAVDVLMPARDSCLQCHGDDRAEAATDCVSCHSFHRVFGSPVTDTRLGKRG